ncbi:hypothetical protein H8356DRAFT_1751309 [Neocallimastix lanati (nom. inval.)]|jgi:coupling of ubiquitin conjugation to ER degradation protein 1|uniref:CUE domain-containing protein n=1 Tax=Neocallimastix californiae TaxID=1754190 RepID=A0A1Y2EGI9_9FUNG|nr:hypothetical protein H8356DRAFT_1751309 [Neocallimastix sp. JGI-2020a]ORY70690.1 hypothetical protein LY90DRAFT_667334 [Neocallimastix californiae]|eukprot:ORY70690.1 hypothetical protein LY90DRAFT_667334 [Neocallimastix californiae]
MADTISIIIGLIIFFFIFKLLFGRSENGNNVGNGRGRHYVNPEDVTTINSMFPQIPRSAIEADLARTGNVNTTCERILAGEIVIPTEPIAAATFNGSSSSRSPLLGKNILKEADLNKPIEEPEKIWKKTTEERQMDFSKRKLYMYQQARKRFLENKEKEKEAATE